MTFYDLMGKYKVSRDSNIEPSHVSMLPYGGIYNIPEEKSEEFYNEYNLHIRKGAKYGILERPKDLGPMLVDIDISKETTENKALYNEKRVLKYVLSFQEQIRETTNIEDPESVLECFVLEKKGYFSNGKFKNGFHLHFPKIWMSKRHRTTITNRVLENFKVGEFETLDNSASRNNWLLYKSRKTEDQEAYKLSYTISHDGKKFKKLPKKDSLVRLLSIRNNPTGNVYEVKSFFVPKESSRYIRPKNNSPPNGELLDRCLKSLDDFRADEYYEWIRIGLVLHTIDPENGLERWREFSKRSEKYNDTNVERTWDGFRNNDRYTVGTLIYLAREDDPSFKVKKKKTYLKRELLEMCKERDLKNYSTLTVSGLCSILGLPEQVKNARGGKKKNVEHVRLLKTTSSKGKQRRAKEKT